MINQFREGEKKHFFPEKLSFWLNREKIYQTKEAISVPNTQAGEEISSEGFRNLTLRHYNRLHPIFNALISLVEYEEISKTENENYFSNPENQRIILKALGLLAEDVIKRPYSEQEEKKYDDYRPFFDFFLGRLRKLEEQINEKGLPNFIDSLAIAFGEGVFQLRRVKNFRIKMEKIRKKITDYLPYLKKIENGKIFEEIKRKIKEIVVVE